ncbi:MAG: hypothetical protein LBF65_00840 [Holosporales bacterium]|jgi:hypothetical protein|nr:hypothetical protein [Holosporales bacterium]
MDIIPVVKLTAVLGTVIPDISCGAVGFNGISSEVIQTPHLALVKQDPFAYHSGLRVAQCSNPALPIPKWEKLVAESATPSLIPFRLNMDQFVYHQFEWLYKNLNNSKTFSSVIPFNRLTDHRFGVTRCFAPMANTTSHEKPIRIAVFQCNANGMCVHETIDIQILLQNRWACGTPKNIADCAYCAALLNTLLPPYQR